MIHLPGGYFWHRAFGAGGHGPQQTSAG